MCTTATQVVGETQLDFFAAWSGVVLQEMNRCHDDATQAVTTLPGIFIQNRLLDNMQSVPLGETLYSFNTGRSNFRYCLRTGIFQLVIHQNSATATLFQTTSVSRAHHAEPSQHVQQRSFRVRLYVL